MKKVLRVEYTHDANVRAVGLCKPFQFICLWRKATENYLHYSHSMVPVYDVFIRGGYLSGDRPSGSAHFSNSSRSSCHRQGQCKVNGFTVALPTRTYCSGMQYVSMEMSREILLTCKRLMSCTYYTTLARCRTCTQARQPVISGGSLKFRVAFPHGHLNLNGLPMANRT